MTTTLTQDQIGIIKDIQDESAFSIFIKANAFHQFEVGDYLNRRDLSEYDEFDNELNVPIWLTSKMAYGCQVPTKWQVIYIDGNGVRYAQQLHEQENGSFAIDDHSEIVSLADSNIKEEQFFIDPEYADHLVFGEGAWDPSASYREWKAERVLFNKEAVNSIIDTSNYTKLHDFFRNMKKGDKFWSIDESVFCNHIEYVMQSKPTYIKVDGRSRQCKLQGGRKENMIIIVKYLRVDECTQSEALSMRHELKSPALKSLKLTRQQPRCINNDSTK